MTNPTREALAAYAHDAWSGWMRYMWSKATANADGTITLPLWAVERWQRQMTTAYADLPESEKASDRKEADQMLAIVGNHGQLEVEHAALLAVCEATLEYWQATGFAECEPGCACVVDQMRAAVAAARPRAGEGE